MAQEQGGKRDGGRDTGSHSRSAPGSGRDSGASRQAGGPDDLKAREYRDEKGQIHHHTRSYMERHGKDGGGKSGGEGRR
jgi:hypothetical protein